MAHIFDRDDRLLLVCCDCGYIISTAPDAKIAGCYDCGRQYRIDGNVVTEIRRIIL